MTGDSSRKSDIAIIHRYFWPQNYPYALMLRHIAEGMGEKGLTVAVYSSHERGSDQKHQREQWSQETGVKVRSLPMKSERGFKIWQKAASALFYAIWVFYVALTSGAKVIWVGTTPPLVMVSVLRVARLFRKFRIIYHCQDIHPEALALNGNVKNSWVLNLLQKIDSSNVKAADAVVTLSTDMRDTIASRPCNTANVRIINNFILEDMPVVQESGESSGHARLLFAGSLGRFQNLEFLTEVCTRLARDHGVETTFMGDGPVRPKMERMVQEQGVEGKVVFTGHRPLSEAMRAMQDADFGLVCLSEGVDRVAYPSKTVMYLASGLPCITFVNPESDLGEMILKEGLGTAVAPGDVDRAVVEIVNLIKKGSEDLRSRPEIAIYAKEQFSKEVVVSKLSALGAELVN